MQTVRERREGAVPRPVLDARWRGLRARVMSVLPGKAGRAVGTFALIGTGVYACAWLGYAFVAYPSHIAVIWPGSGFLLAALVLLDRRLWPAALAAAVVANATADLQHGGSLPVSLAGGAANALESLVAALVLVRLVGPRISLRNLREVGALVFGGALLSNALTSVLGALVLTLGWRSLFPFDWQGTFWHDCVVWWVGDGMGMLVVTPVILTWAALVRERERIRASMALEAAVILGVTAVVAQLALTREPASGGALGSFPYLAFPLLIWTGIRLGPVGAATATLLLSMITAWDASRPPGLYSQTGLSSLTQVLQIYAYLALAGLSSLVPAVVLRERKDAEEQLRASEARFRQIAETIKEAFYIVDLTTWEPLYVSPTWAEIWGRPLEDGRDPGIWFDSIHPDDQATIRADQAEVARGSATTTVFRVLRPDGSMRWVRARAFPVMDASGRVYRLAGLAEDITEMREVEERLIQAQRMEAVGQLAGGVAHDFNNLLTVILGSTDLAMRELPEDAPAREDLATIMEASESASKLTRQLLAFGRKQLLQPKVLRLNEVITRTNGMLGRLLGENIELTTSLDPDAGAIRADVGSLEQVLVNLVVNARDAMPGGGTVHVALRNVDLEEASGPLALPHGRYVALTVTDTGEGMDETTKARAFEPFFTTKERGRGTGLGLATVYGIVRQSGGHISVESEVGKGTCVVMYFPRVVDPARETESTASAGRPHAGTETVLVVEDQAGVRSVMRQALCRSGYRVIEAASGEDALGLLERDRNDIDLLVTDVVMPGMSGRDLADRFAELRPDAPILFVSGYTDDALLRHGVLAAEVEYLAKPFSPELLTQTVRRLFDARGSV